MSQYLIVLDLLKKAVGDDYRRHIIVTTSKEKGFLIKIAREEGYETFYIQTAWAAASPSSARSAARRRRHRRRHPRHGRRRQGNGRALRFQ